MAKIVSKRFFSENVAELVLEAPLIANSRRAGHFVMVRVDEHSERMPLTIADADTDNGKHKQDRKYDQHTFKARFQFMNKHHI